MQIGNYNFVQTCSCSPEQYDVFDKDGNQVCYVRLRWGSLYAQCPDVGGLEVYDASIGDGWTGCFESEEQRMVHLRKIAEAIDTFMGQTCYDCEWFEWDYTEENRRALDETGFPINYQCDYDQCIHCRPTSKPCGHFCKIFMEDEE